MNTREQYELAYRESRIMVQVKRDYVDKYMTWVHNWQGSQTIRQCAVNCHQSTINPRKSTYYFLKYGLERIDQKQREIKQYQRWADNARKAKSM